MASGARQDETLLSASVGNPAISTSGSAAHPAPIPPPTSTNGGFPRPDPTPGPSGPIKTPVPYLSQASVPPSPQPLNPTQSEKYASLLSIVTSWTELPTTSVAKSRTAPLTDAERIWLTRECLLRYLRATKWSVTDASARLRATLVWRREYIRPEHNGAYFSEENETGKQILYGWDAAGRPCLYLNPKQQNTDNTDKQVQQLVFMLERAIDLMVPEQDTITLLINFKGAMQSPKVGQGRQALNILQSHYPERLGRAMVNNIPWLIWAFLKLINPFIDPNTREKLKFDQDLRQLVPPEQLLKNYSGDADFVYDHAVYWPALQELAAARRGAVIDRWVRGGKHIGESEAFLKGGEAKGVGTLQDVGEGREEKGAEAEV